MTRTQPALEVLIGCCHRARQATNHVHGGQSLKESSVVGEVSPKRNRPCSLAASALLCLEHRHLAQFTSSFLPPIRYTLLLLLSHTASTTQTLNHPNDSEHIYIHTFKTSQASYPLYLAPVPAPVPTPSKKAAAAVAAGAAFLTDASKGPSRNKRTTTGGHGLSRRALRNVPGGRAGCDDLRVFLG